MHNKNFKLVGHLFAFVTIFIWSIAFVSNKALLSYISPIDNMIMRFSIGYILLLIIYPKWKLPQSFRDEIFFAMLGFLGIFIYFLMENFALTYTQATNVGLYMGAIPIITALFAHFLSKNERLSPALIKGFLVAMLGIGMILLDGAEYQARLKGDLLALGAAGVFALYSVVIRFAPSGYHYIVITRKSFLYGLAMMVAFRAYTLDTLDVQVLANATVWGNVLFLGVLSSGIAFILWHQGIERIGSIQASNYIYLVPLITAITGILTLDEHMTLQMFAGAVLILAGLYLAQRDD